MHIKPLVIDDVFIGEVKPQVKGGSGAVCCIHQVEGRGELDE